MCPLRVRVECSRYISKFGRNRFSRCNAFSIEGEGITQGTIEWYRGRRWEAETNHQLVAVLVSVRNSHLFDSREEGDGSVYICRSFTSVVFPNDLQERHI